MYNLTELEIQKLTECWIINWCGGKWWVNFDKILRDNLEIIPWFNKNNTLFEKIRLICYSHDIWFRFKRWFYLSNFIFSYDLYKLLRSSKKQWITRKQAFIIWSIVFVLLNRYWKEFYKN